MDDDKIKSPTSALSDFELQLVHSLGTLRSIEAVQWDLLGERLVIQAHAGPVSGRLRPVVWSIPRALVAGLHSQLGQALADRDTLKDAMQ